MYIYIYIYSYVYIPLSNSFSLVPPPLFGLHRVPPRSSEISLIEICTSRKKVNDTKIHASPDQMQGNGRLRLCSVWMKVQ